jgi:hypothetical protein
VDPSHVAVVRPADARIPRGLRALPVLDGADPAGLTGYRRVVVLGPPAELAAVLTRLLRADRLDIEVAHVARPWHSRRALAGSATRVPLIRDDTGTVLVEAAHWLPTDGERVLHGEAVVDDQLLFDGEVAGVRVEPIRQMPGLRACVLPGHPRPKRWVTGRAAQLGTTGALVLRDGRAAPRPVRRSTFYRHTEGWLRVASAG